MEIEGEVIIRRNWNLYLLMRDIYRKVKIFSEILDL